MTTFKLPPDVVDVNDPLLQALNNVFVKDSKPQSTIFGDAKTYNLATIPPWNDVTDIEGAQFNAEKTIEALTTANDNGHKILDSAAPKGTVTLSAYVLAFVFRFLRTNDLS